MKRLLYIIFFAYLAIEGINTQGQTKSLSAQSQPDQLGRTGVGRPWSQQMAATIMNVWKDSTDPSKPAKWTYDQGVVLKGMEGLWYHTADGKYFRYIQKSVDNLVGKDGDIKTYKADEYQLDNILGGRILLTLFKVTNDPKYFKAASILRDQLRTQPRTKEGGFWHKKRYPYQMWLDGLYMAEPFYAEWAATFKEDSDFNDIANQFIWMEEHARDPKTGLLYHGWDESKEQKWADKQTGNSPHFWARAMGWYGMALVDALPWFPANHPKRGALIKILQRYAAAIKKTQDHDTGLWWDIMNFPSRQGNYLEASASCMFVYTLAKGVRLGYLPESSLPDAVNGYLGILNKFAKTDADGNASLEGTVSVSGLGGDPYRDGSYEYYIGEKVVKNDAKGVGAFLLASDEMDIAPLPTYGKGKTVTLDYYFNNEPLKNLGGVMMRNHYTWNDMSYGGFSLLGEIFKNKGASINYLESAPTTKNLAGSSVYIIVDPDNLKDNPNPNYVEESHVKAIADWVKQGGVLLLMANDSANCDLHHFNKLAQAFGITFSDRGRNFVKGTEYETGAIHITDDNPIFKQTKKVYLKEISIIETKEPAKGVVTEGGDIIMATAKYGKGTVFAVGDPWIYNEYTDGRKIDQSVYQDFSAANELAKWLLEQAAKK
jgi:unsaturated rhamnogalacturonyl hydrolase